MALGDVEIMWSLGDVAILTLSRGGFRGRIREGLRMLPKVRYAPPRAQSLDSSCVNMCVVCSKRCFVFGL